MKYIQIHIQNHPRAPGQKSDMGSGGMRPERRYPIGGPGGWGGAAPNQILLSIPHPDAGIWILCPTASWGQRVGGWPGCNFNVGCVNTSVCGSHTLPRSMAYDPDLAQLVSQPVPQTELLRRVLLYRDTSGTTLRGDGW